MKKYLVIFISYIIVGCSNGEPVPALIKNYSSYNDTTVGELPIRLTTQVPDTKFSNMQFSTITSDSYNGEHIEFLE